MSSGGISENSQKIGFFCSMGKKKNVKVVIFKNIQIYKNCHFPNLIFSRCTPLLLILMWCHFGINIIELVFLQMLHPLGANCAPLLLPCYHMTHRSCCCCFYWSCYCTLTVWILHFEVLAFWNVKIFWIGFLHEFGNFKQKFFYISKCNFFYIFPIYLVTYLYISIYFLSFL